MTDRVIVYDGALPQSTDILNTGKGAMVGDAYGWLTILGSATVVGGLACNPTGPPSMNVTITPGAIFSLLAADQNPYADLGSDAQTIIKQGILYSPINLLLTAPTTVGFSQNYLVQAIQSDVDGGLATLPYFNATPPNNPFSGPGGSGTSQFTIRQGKCIVSLVAGTAATTGTQTTPAPNAGNVGLYAITVANGQVTIQSNNIVKLASAPFLPVNGQLPLIPFAVQSCTWTYAVDTGNVSNTIVIAPALPDTAYNAGEMFQIKLANDLNGPATVAISGQSTVAVINNFDGSPIGGLVAKAGCIVAMQYDGVAMRILSPDTSAVHIQPTGNNYFVSTTGNDGNPGTAGSPFLTIQKAINVISQLGANSGLMTINVGSGTFSGFIVPNYPIAPFQVLGNGIANTFLTSAAVNTVTVQGANTCTLKGMAIANTNTGSQSNCLLAIFGATVNVGGLSGATPVYFNGNSGSTLGNFISAQNGGIVNVNSIQIGNTATGSVLAANGAGASINTSNMACVCLSSTVAFFANSAQLGQITQGPTNGTFTTPNNCSNSSGFSASAALNGIISTNGGGIHFFPNTANTFTTSTGGQYL